MGQIGRPRLTTGTPINSRQAEWCYSWIQYDWAAINAEDCPTGRDYQKVVGFFSRKDVHEQYTKAFSFTTDYAVGLKPLSLSTFRKILKYYMTKNGIAERNKKNVSGKCEGCWLVEIKY
jgi:hypothetical protein